jgi:small-conductance mechanosensitive channel
MASEYYPVATECYCYSSSLYRSSHNFPDSAAGNEKMAASTDNDVDDRLVHFLQRFYVLVLMFVFFLVILRIHEIEITPFLASAGIAEIAIGMAAKETLADVFAGVFLIADRPVRVGDRVKIDSIGKHW